VNGAKSVLPDEQSGRGFVPVNHFSTKFDGQAGEGAIGMNAATDAVAAFEECNLFAGVVEILCGGESGSTRADDQGGHETPVCAPAWGITSKNVHFYHKPALPLVKRATVAARQSGLCEWFHDRG
jgi:hypothetical protein